MDPAVLDHIQTQFLTSATQVAAQRLAHTAEVATAYSQVGVQQQNLYTATGANMLTGTLNQQANTQQALKSTGYFPTVLPIAPTPVIKES